MKNGQLSIGRAHGLIEDYVSIIVTDVKSGVDFLELKLNCENFGKAITGLGHVHTTFELHNVDLVGKIREHMAHDIPTKKGGTDYTDEKMIKMAQALEINGWGCRYDDLKNHHNWITKDGRRYVRITYTRFVKEVSDVKQREKKNI